SDWGGISHGALNFGSNTDIATAGGVFAKYRAGQYGPGVYAGGNTFFNPIGPFNSEGPNSTSTPGVLGPVFSGAPFTQQQPNGNSRGGMDAIPQSAGGLLNNPGVGFNGNPMGTPTAPGFGAWAGLTPDTSNSTTDNNSGVSPALAPQYAGPPNG